MVEKTARTERQVMLVAALGVILGGFFPWVQPLDLTVWVYDDGDALVVLSSAAVTVIFVWIQWRKITAYIAIAFALFILIVAAVNITSELGPEIILSTVASVTIMIAGASAAHKFEHYI
ncbi:hypothetical protein [Halalkalicoccus tibetensis]|uniref:SPW repeat-containing protein n=1 Tax=Halalkalicoccus tibetensis TaxID=175632 RepID=A0ABD5V758_9EURY